MNKIATIVLATIVFASTAKAETPTPIDPNQAYCKSGSLASGAHFIICDHPWEHLEMFSTDNFSVATDFCDQFRNHTNGWRVQINYFDANENVRRICDLP